MSLTEPTKKISKSAMMKNVSFISQTILRCQKENHVCRYRFNLAFIQYDVENQPGIANLLTIHSTLTGESIDSIVERFKGKGYGDLKKEIGDNIEKFLTELQGRYNEIINSGICEQVLEEGRLKAGKLAHKKLMKVKKRVGFQIFNH